MHSRLYVWDDFPAYFRGLGRVLYQLQRFPFGMPQIEQTDDRVYFTDARGQRWRVHDVSFGTPYAKPYHYHRFACGDGRATSRVFVDAAGERRSYAFKKGESRELSAEALEVQLARAGWLGRDNFDPSKRKARD